jgi:hypothetical protein
VVAPVNEASVDVKEPVPVPLLVVLFEMVGLDEVLYTTPRTVTDRPPSSVIFPPLLAPVVVMLLIAVVVTVGIHATVIVPVAFTLPHPPVNGIL